MFGFFGVTLLILTCVSLEDREDNLVSKMRPMEYDVHLVLVGACPKSFDRPVGCR